MISTKEVIEKAIHYFYLIIVIVGTVANALAFIVFSRKKFKNTVFSTYFRILLIIDTFGLLYLTLSKFLTFEFGIRLRNINAFLCRMTMPITYSIPPISSYITALISFDRWMSIAKPNVFPIRKKKKFQLNACAIIVLANFVYNGQLFFSPFIIDPENKGDNQCLFYDENLLVKMDLIVTHLVYIKNVWRY
jgi:hypothetical protein